MPSVYLLRCADGSLYCGWTTDLARRLSAHAAGTASRYTRSRRPVALAAVVPVADRSAALREEARIKRLPRTAKLRLVKRAGEQRMITKLDFVGIPTRDPERSRAFYVETLGLRPDDHSRFEFWVGDTCCGIWQPERVGMPFAPQKNGHLALHVDDVAATRADLEAKGIAFAGETLDTGVCHMALFTDPDGNDLMLHHRYAPVGEGG